MICELERKTMNFCTYTYTVIHIWNKNNKRKMIPQDQRAKQKKAKHNRTKQKNNKSEATLSPLIWT